MPTDTIRFNNVGGALVEVTRWMLTHRWWCHGCNQHGRFTASRNRASTEANGHAANCRALPR